MTQGILILIAALGGAFIGAIVSGGLLILSHHLQAKRVDQRQQRAFERAARSESLERIKNAVDMGLKMVTLFSQNRGSAIVLMPEFNLALNGAIVSARVAEADYLEDELRVLLSLMRDFAGSKDVNSAMVEVEARLASIDNHYIELRIGYPPRRPSHIDPAKRRAEIWATWET